MEEGQVAFGLTSVLPFSLSFRTPLQFESGEPWLARPRPPSPFVLAAAATAAAANAAPAAVPSAADYVLPSSRSRLAGFPQLMSLHGLAAGDSKPALPSSVCSSIKRFKTTLKCRPPPIVCLCHFKSTTFCFLQASTVENSIRILAEGLIAILTRCLRRVPTRMTKGCIDPLPLSE